MSQSRSGLLGKSASDVDALLDSAKAFRLSNVMGSVDKWGIGSLSLAQTKELLNTQNMP
jgi:hypothetical protein